MTAEKARELIIYLMEQFASTEDDRQACSMAIKALERSRWIPTAERLPRTEQYALITVHNQTKMCWYQNGVFVDGEQNAYTKEDEELVAWMPLPEPYRAESEDL